MKHGLENEKHFNDREKSELKLKLSTHTKIVSYLISSLFFELGLDNNIVNGCNFS